MKISFVYRMIGNLLPEEI